MQLVRRRSVHKSFRTSCPTREHIDHLLVNSGTGRKSTNGRGGNPDNFNDFKLHRMLFNTYRKPSSFTPRHTGAVVVPADDSATLSQSAYRPKEQQIHRLHVASISSTVHTEHKTKPRPPTNTFSPPPSIELTLKFRPVPSGAPDASTS